MTLGLLILRLALGLTLAAHGSQKLFGAFGGGGLDGTAGYMEKLGFRPGRRSAEMAGAAEFVGGLLLALGLLTPLASAVIMGVMAVAAIAGHEGKGFFIVKGGWEYTFVLAVSAWALAFTGPGLISFDAALGLDLDGIIWGVLAAVLAVGGAAAQLSMRGRVPDEADAEARDYR